MHNEMMGKNSGSMHHCLKSSGLLALRIALAIIFIYSGYQKLFPAHAMTVEMFGKMGFSPAGFWTWLVAIVEFFGGLMILLGVYARYAAVPLAITMIVAIIVVLRGGPVTGSFLPLAMLGGCLAILGVGAGKFRLVKNECHCGHCKMMGKDQPGGCCGGKGMCACQDAQAMK